MLAGILIGLLIGSAVVAGALGVARGIRHFRVYVTEIVISASQR